MSLINAMARIQNIGPSISRRGFLRKALVRTLTLGGASVLGGCHSTPPTRKPEIFPSEGKQISLEVSGKKFLFQIYGHLTNRDKFKLQEALALYPPLVIEYFAMGGPGATPPLSIYLTDATVAQLSLRAVYIVLTNGERQLFLRRGVFDVREAVHELGHAMSDYLVAQNPGNPWNEQSEYFDMLIQEPLLTHKRNQIAKARSELETISPELLPTFDTYMAFHSGEVDSLGHPQMALENNFWAFHMDLIFRKIMENHFVSWEAYIVQPDGSWPREQLIHEYWTETWTYFLLNPMRLKAIDPVMYGAMEILDGQLRTDGFDPQLAVEEIRRAFP